ncbi:MAG: Trm112 family protein [Planctomycetes bacterium]|nr:Trm112 family protein [Planctomycetota bacterium]
MELDPEWLAMLRSPGTRRPLRLLDAERLTALNARIRAGGVVDRGGEAVVEPLQAGLVPDGEAVVYPIVHDFPDLLADRAIELPPA